MKPKGRRVAAPPGSAPKRRKNARDRTAAATLGVMMKAKESRIGVREAACDERDAQAAECNEQQAKKAAELDEREAGLDEREAGLDERDGQQHAQQAYSASLTAREVEVERREAAFDEREREAARAKEMTREQCTRREAASSARDKMGHRSGALLSASQSQDILLLYFGLVQDGMEENPAAKRTAELLRVGKDKVYKVNTAL